MCNYEHSLIDWSIFQGIYSTISTLHCLLAAHLVVAVALLEVLRLSHEDVRLLVILELIKIGLVADGIAVVTTQLRHRSALKGTSDFLLGPLLVGCSTELAATSFMLRTGQTSSAGFFLVGGGYAKILILGASCLAVQGLSSNELPQTWQRDSWVLVLSGGLVFVVSSIKGTLEDLEKYLHETLTYLILQYCLFTSSYILVWPITSFVETMNALRR